MSKLTIREREKIFNKLNRSCKKNILKIILKFGMSRIRPEPQGTTHAGETETGSHNRANFRIRLQQPL